MTYLGGGMALVGGAAIKQSMNFQTAMTRVSTQAQLPLKTLGAMSDAVLKLGASGKVPYGPTELANALYHIESVAVGGTVKIKGIAQATNVLRIASQGAAVGGANLEDTTTALMGAMAAMHTPASKAARVMGLINATVGAGNMRMQDLTLALGRGLIPAFKNVGMTATDAFGAVALAADQGTKAGSAAAQLATALHYLADPTTKASKLFARLGLAPEKFAKDVYGPGGMLRGLTDVQKVLSNLPGWERARAIFELMPAGRGRVLQQILNNLTQYGGKLKAIAHPQLSFNEAVGVWSKTLSAKLHISWAQIQTDLVKMGTALSPIVSHYLPMFTKDIREVVQWFTQLPGWVQKSLVKLTAVFLVGGPILYGVGRAITLFRQLRDILFAVRGAGYAAAAGEAAAAAAGGGSAAGGAGGAAAGAAGARATGGRFTAGATAGRAAKFGKFLKLAPFIAAGAAFDAVPAIAALLGFYVGGNALLGPKGLDILGSNHPFGSNPHHLHGSRGRGYLYHGATGGLVTRSGIRGYQSGGYVDDQPAMLTIGEGVLNRTAMSGIGIGGLNALNSGRGLGGMKIESAPVYITLDGRVLARAVLQQTLRTAARGPSSLVGGQIVTNVR